MSRYTGKQETLTELKNRGYHIGILTTNSRKNVKIFLEKEG
ncbi:MAG: HAD family hydrolase [Coxiellaceae bacterium]|nr:HAD family hydrolase [Coxiellaceae bacterium]